MTLKKSALRHILKISLLKPKPESIKALPTQHHLCDSSPSDLIFLVLLIMRMKYFYCHIHPFLSHTNNECSHFQSPTFCDFSSAFWSPWPYLYLPSFSSHFRSSCCCMDFLGPFVTLSYFGMETLMSPPLYWEPIP